MPFDAFSLEMAAFLSLVTILASLPTDPYYHPWHDDPPSYWMSRGAQRLPPGGGGDPRIERRVPGPWLPEQGPPPPRDWWPRGERGGGGGGGQDEGRDFHGRPRWAAGGGARRRTSHRRNSHADPGVKNTGNGYSSQVDCEAGEESNEAAEKTPKDFRELQASEKVDERVNLEEGSRSVRTGTPREGDTPNPRIVTPKGRRRPPQGTVNPMPTTEKTFRNHTGKVSKKPRPNNSKPQGGDIVFPDGYQKKFIPRISKCAKKSTFCEHVGEEYPSDYIGQVLKKEGAMFREFFGRDVISDPNITERINAPEENSLCPYRQEVVFPRAAQNKEDKWLFIVNQDQYVQGVTVEVCLNPESRCILTEGFPLGYTPYCKQKYIERRLVAIGEDGKPHSDSFRLPSCCSCVVKHESSARTGLPRSSREAPAPPLTPHR